MNKRNFVFMVLFWLTTPLFATEDSSVTSNIVATYSELWTIQDLEGISYLNQYIENDARYYHLPQWDIQLKSKHSRAKALIKAANQMEIIASNSSFQLQREELDKAMSGFFVQLQRSGCGMNDSTCDQFNKSISSLNSRQPSLDYFLNMASSFYKEAMINAMITYGELESYLHIPNRNLNFETYLRGQLELQFCEEPKHPGSVELKYPRNPNSGLACLGAIDEVFFRHRFREKLPIEIVTEQVNSLINSFNLDLHMYVSNLKRAAGASNRTKSEEFSIKAEQNYQEYIIGIMAATGQLPGTLLTTDTLKMSGSGRVFEKQEIRSTGYSPRHSITGKENMIEAIEEAKRIAVESTNEIHDQYYAIQETQRIYQIKRYIDGVVAQFPIPVAAAILQTPDYMYQFVDSLNTNLVNLQSQQNFDRYFMWGCALVGGILFLTGVFAFGGVLLLGKAAMIGGIYLASIAQFTGTVGTIVGVITAAQSAKVAIIKYGEYKDLEQAVFTGNSSGGYRLEGLHQDYKEAMINAGVALGTVVLDVGMLKYMKHMKPSEIAEVTSNINNNVRNGTFQAGGGKRSVLEFLEGLNLAGRIRNVRTINFNRYREMLRTKFRNAGSFRFSAVDAGVSPAIQTARKLNSFTSDQQQTINNLVRVSKRRSLADYDELRRAFSFPELSSATPMVETMSIEMVKGNRRFVSQTYSDMLVHSVDNIQVPMDDAARLFANGLGREAVPDVVHIWHTHVDPVPLTSADDVVARTIQQFYGVEVQMHAILDISGDITVLTSIY